MFTRILLVTMLLSMLLAVGMRFGVAQEEDTLGLSIGAYNCDANPFENPNATCVPNGGTVINVTLESGEFIGSCTLETFATPNGGVVSVCGVEGVPFNSTLIISEDESTLPAGYVPINSPQVFQTTDIIPGGGDGPVIEFINVLIDDGPASVSNEIPNEDPAVPEEAEEVAPEPEGRASAIYTGSCDELGEVAATLPNIVDPQGRPVGQSSAIEAGTASSTIDVSLDVLLDKEHAVAVLESNTPDADVIACGDIGGVDNDDGELVIGLREVDGSGFAGVVYLAYNEADGSQTNVSAFLAEGLADSP